MGRRILIIDDNEQDRKIIKRLLIKQGHQEILTAANGREGVEKAKSQKPELVILDTLLPDALGFDVCSRIRQNQGADKPLIIMLTGTVDAVDAVRARQAGADDYCVKTVDCLPLLGALKNLLDEGK
jgi:DNA-binding response OmpR family regulator